MSSMSLISTVIQVGSLLQKKNENHAKFAVIQKRIESRIIPIATPMEIIRLTRIVKDNDRLQALMDTAITAETDRFNEEHPDNPIQK